MDYNAVSIHGENGFHRWIGWGVIAGNLAVMAEQRNLTQASKIFDYQSTKQKNTHLHVQNYSATPFPLLSLQFCTRN